MRGKAAGNPTKKRQTGPKPAKKAADEPKQTAGAFPPVQDAPPPATEPTTASPPPAGHNSGEISVEERQYQTCRARDKVIDLRKSRASIDAEIRSVFKNYKKDYEISKSLIEAAITAATPEGRLSLLARAQETKEVLANYPEGTQFAMDFGPQPPEPTTVTADREGRLAFDNGETATGGRWAPGTPEEQAWLNGYHEKAARRVRGGIRTLHIAGPLPLEEAIANAPTSTETLDRGMEALDSAIDDALGEAIQAVMGEPMSETELVADLENAGYLPPDQVETTPPAPVEMMPPEPGMPREEWKENMAADLDAEKQFIRHGTPIPETPF